VVELEALAADGGDEGVGVELVGVDEVSVGEGVGSLRQVELDAVDEVVLGGQEAVAVEAGGEVAVGEDAGAGVAAGLGIGEEGLGAGGVVDVAVGVDDRLDGGLRVVGAQVVEGAGGDLGDRGVDEEDAIVAEEGGASLSSLPLPTSKG